MENEELDEIGPFVEATLVGIKALQRRMRKLEERNGQLEHLAEQYKPFMFWAQDYLDANRWTGHSCCDAVKTELLERDATVEEMKEIGERMAIVLQENGKRELAEEWYILNESNKTEQITKD